MKGVRESLSLGSDGCNFCCLKCCGKVQFIGFMVIKGGRPCYLEETQEQRSVKYDGFPEMQVTSSISGNSFNWA